MYIIINNRKLIPGRLNFTKTVKPQNNQITFDLFYEEYKNINLNDEFIVYSNDGQQIYNGYVVDKTLSVKNGNVQLTLRGYDKESLIFNRQWSETMTGEVPIILGKLIAKTTNDLKGIHLSRVKVKFVGYPRTDGIQVTLKEHPEIEFTLEDIENNTTAYQDYVNLPAEDKFPTITFSAMTKPIYEWFTNLTKEKYLGVDKHFIWFLDYNDLFRWYATDSVSPKKLELFNDYQLKYSQESKVNFIIAYLGDDLNGAPIYIYAYKDYSGTPNLQDTIKDWADIARDLKDQYTDNDLFRQAVREAGMQRAKAYFESMTLGRIEGEFTTKNFIYYLGDRLFIKHAFGNDSYYVEITEFTASWDLKNGETYTYKFEEVIE